MNIKMKNGYSIESNDIGDKFVGAKNSVQIYFMEKSTMSRNILISRAEAEFLTDLFYITDHYLAADLDDQIREKFGMAPRERDMTDPKEALSRINLNKVNDEAT